MATIRDVAKRAGVSVATVSHAMSGKRPVAEATRLRILAAAEELRYQPNQLAISMLTGRTMTLGALVPDISNPFFGELLGAVETSAAARGYMTVVCSTELQLSMEEHYLEALCAKHVDAILLIGCSDDALPRIPELPDGPPVVVVDQVPVAGSPLSFVSSDHQAGGRLAAAHLLELGHRGIGVIAGPTMLSTAGARLDGFLAELRAHRRPVPKRLVAKADHFTLPSGLVAARELLERHRDVTAVFCANDLIAYGALQAAAELGIAVPEELSVVGFDDIFVSAMVTPTLTTIRQPIRELGRLAVEVAFGHLDGSLPRAFVRDLPVELVRRSSTAPPPQRPRRPASPGGAHGHRAADR